MAKIIKMNNSKNQELDYKDFLNQQPEDIKEMLSQFNIRSYENLAEFSIALGIDIEKMIEYDEKHPDGDLKDIPFEQFMMDKDHPLYHESIGSEDEEDNEFDHEMDYMEYFGDESDYLPERVFIGNKAVEYHIRLKLCNAPLPIWRELKLPSNITLEALSCIIIEAMGWENRHLHQFKKGDTFYKDTEDLREEEDMFPFSRFRKENSNNWSLFQVLPEKGDRIEYEYDFGDSWRHEIWVKGIREYIPGEYQKPTIIKGKGACPPEDCGGVWGYSDLLRIHSKKRKTKEEKEQLEWCNMDKYFNPEEFDIEEAQDCLDILWKELLILNE